MAKKPVQLDHIDDLQVGTIIRHVNESRAYVVHANYGGHAIAVRVVHVSNVREWLIVGGPGSQDE